MIGYSEGRFRGGDATFTSGGQCENGLKMIFVIGEAKVPTSGGNDPGPGGDQPHGTESPQSPENQGCE